MYVDMALDCLIERAVKDGASDIHFDAGPQGWLVRFRLDGYLADVDVINRLDGEQYINRIKVLSGLDISEKRLPQDGRWVWEQDNIQSTMRVSTLPSVYGETVVCRIMGNEGSCKSLVELGMEPWLFEKIQLLLKRPYGLFLICGPTGSGKTSTLYAALRLLECKEMKVICLEDPVEAPIEGAIQVAINEKIGFTFANGLRSVLRQDPDTIMVGEIRDQETACLAVQAALTGHRVLSTLHTNTAMGAWERLIDMGVEAYLLRATLIGALAQRLVRRCNHQGHYRGRMALFEYWEVPEGQARWDSMETFLQCSLSQSASRAVLQGKTTVEEIERLGLAVDGML